MASSSFSAGIFLSTPSARRATVECGGQIITNLAFLSTPSARRATVDLAAAIDRIHISIHALREEGDLLLCVPAGYFSGISIHALREEGDGNGSRAHGPCRVFLSTPSARRATGRDLSGRHQLGYFYPRPPRGGRPCPLRMQGLTITFLSTPSARRATATQRCSFASSMISIHALREEGDSKNREKTLCFCLIIHLSAQIAKRCL